MVSEVNTDARMLPLVCDAVASGLCGRSGASIVINVKNNVKVGCWSGWRSAGKKIC
jgi:hypothetical protein